VTDAAERRQITPFNEEIAMFQSHRHTGVRSHRVLATLAIVAASAGAGFAVGRHPDIGQGARAASRAPAAPVGSVAAPSHDDSIPDSADTLGREKLRDEEASPTF
jgi:hypothetical protein